MSTHKLQPRALTPLRDRRVTSNSPTTMSARSDPVKSSILRESGLGWTSPTPAASDSGLSLAATTTTPLRIAKRDTPQRSQQHQHQSQITRRTSSTYKRLGNNNLVSKSPFKSQIPTPKSAPPLPSKLTPSSTPMVFPLPPVSRKVSGEKRPRPFSMQEQAEAENDRPFAYKRERRQSKGYQGLISKEPVTRSPFKARVAGRSGMESPLPPLPSAAQQQQDEQQQQQSAGPSSREGSPSPVRSSLVSKRLHGPRLSGSGNEPRRQRRKTVTFDEECDVVEFDTEEPEEDDDDDGDRYGHDEEDEDYNGSYEKDESMEVDVDDVIKDMEVDEHQERQPYRPHPDDLSYEPEHGPNPSHPHDEPEGDNPDGSFESVPLDVEGADDSITGIVNSMLNQANAAVGVVRTPERTPTYPSDGENGIPYGRTHHYERVLEQRHRSPPHRIVSPSSYPFQINTTIVARTPSPPGPSPASVPRSARRVTSPSPLSQSPLSPADLSSASRGPLGRSTHRERARAERMVEEEVERGVRGLEGSPSPMKPGKAANLTTENSREDLVPKFDVSFTRSENDDDKGDDPFAIPSPMHHKPHRVELSFTSQDDPSDSDSMEMDPANLSIGHSEVSLGGLEMELGIRRLNGDKPKSKSSEDFTSPAALPRPSTPESDSSDTSLSSATHDSPSSVEGEAPAEPSTADPDPLPPHFRAMSPAGQEQLGRSGSLGSLASSGSMNSRTPRISREEVQRRLMRQRSVESPASETLDRLQAIQERADDGKRMSVMTDFDMSTETATIETVVERRKIAMAASAPTPSYGSQSPKIDLPQVGGEGLKFDFSQFGMGPTPGIGEVDVDMKSALDRLMDDVAGAEEKAIGMRVEAVTEGIQAGRFDVDDSMRTETTDVTEEYDEQPLGMQLGMGRPPVARAVTEPDVFTLANSRSASGSTIPPAPPPKDAIRSREELIIEKRREARKREEDESMGYYTPPRESDRALAQAKQNRRRSRSTGDIQEVVKQTEGSGMLAVGELEKTDDDLGDSIQRELRKLGGGRSTYHIKEQATIYASSNPVTHMTSAGDVNAGKAWRPVRRPSDMNEYSKQIKEYRAQEKPGKAHGKVFVRVLGIKGINVPLPYEPTAVTCTLNNGIHYVTTPECRLGRDSRIDQEFELIEHSKLEFTLTMKIRRDPHIISMFKAIAPTPPQPPPPAPPSRSGMRAFFSSPKKPARAPPRPVAPPHLPENLARYLKPDGTLARAFISFKDIAPRCDTRLFETNYPLIGQRIEVGGAMSTLQVGELALQVFRLPPLPGVAPEQLPQSLEECHRGLRHNNWHKNTYFEGTLTQQGGDCMTWRRRQLRVIGANLVAFNDVTKKATATIGLKKAIAVEDDQEARGDVFSPASGVTARSTRALDDYDGVGGVERSFRLIFPNDEEIVFFADTDDEKAKWLEVLRALVGHIPPNPLWAELVWQRQEELKKQAVAPQPSPNRPTFSARMDPGMTRGQQG